MKISANQGISVNISALRETGLLLKNIKPGDTVAAVILRSEGSRASLDIGGRVITAEFTNGVPAEKNIELVLTFKNAEKVQFSLKEGGFEDKIIKYIAPFSVMHDNEPDSNSLRSLARFIFTSKPDLADINLFLAGYKKDKQKDKSGSSFFNNILKKGVPFQTLIDLAYVVYSRYNPVLFAAYRNMLFLTGKKDFNSGKRDLSEFENGMDSLFDAMKDDDSDFSLMLDLVSDENKRREKYGELVFPEEESFSTVEYIINGDSVFLRFNLSTAGEVSVLVKTLKDTVLINFLVFKDDVLQFLEQNEKDLRQMLEQNGIKKTIIGYFDSKKVVDKIKLWSIDFHTKYGFNAKA
jgi:hypothetical protein